MLPRELIAILWALAIAVLVWSLIERARARRIRERLERLQVIPPLGESDSAVGASNSAVHTLGVRLDQRVPGLTARGRAHAYEAGITTMTGEELVGWQALAALGGLLVGVYLMTLAGPAGIVFPLVLTPIGWFAFDAWVNRLVSARNKSIERSLLIVMDLLSLSLEAGMGLDRALRLICDRVQSPLTVELRRTLSEIDVGVPRREAFTHLAERLNTEDIRALTTAIVQAEELSMSIVDSMRIQAQSLRVKRREEAEAEAQRAPVKMLFPMALFVMPALFIVILAPAAIALMNALGPL